MKIITRIFYGFLIAILFKTIVPVLNHTTIAVSIIIAVIGSVLGGYFGDLMFENVHSPLLKQLYQSLVAINFAVISVIIFNLWYQNNNKK